MMGLHSKWIVRLGAAALACCTAFVTPPVMAQEEPEEDEDFIPLAPLWTVEVPGPDNLDEFICDKDAAIALGKALFWDMQAGSDGIQACASCHFNNGADSRHNNQLNPGKVSKGNTDFDIRGPNYRLKKEDFPFTDFFDPADRDSGRSRDTSVVASSQGVFPSTFVDIAPGDCADVQTCDDDPVWNVHGIESRRVEPRNTPSVLNAVFNDRNFWDGRAKNDFNGVDPFGSRNPDAKLIKAVTRYQLEEVSVSLKNSSLASQAVGPPLSPFEMSAGGRKFRDIGKKLLKLRPLSKQLVHWDDSVLAPYVVDPNNLGYGLIVKYKDLIKQAFKPCWWDSRKIIKVLDDGSLRIRSIPNRPLRSNEYLLAEWNFSLFWGLAIQSYESTLITSETPFDFWLAGDETALTDKEKAGFAIFDGKGRCSNCHGGPVLTKATVDHVQNQPLERMLMGNDQIAVYDNAFYNIGVRPTCEDVGLGGFDPFGTPLSNTRLAKLGLFNNDNVGIQVNERDAVQGSFKTPGLRNIAFTAPYFHNGGKRTLREVVEFYNRGGDFNNENQDDLDPDIRTLDLTEEEIDCLIAFMKRGLTDDRAVIQAAPFDHPGLMIPNGHRGDHNGTVNVNGKSKDRFMVIEPTGRHGGEPLPRFLKDDAEF